MTREDVLSLLGDTQDVGSGIYIYLYEVDQQYLLRIPFASDEAQLGVTGEDLLKALVPISGDIAPMVYVNDTLYQIVDSQPNFADEKSSFNIKELICILSAELWENIFQFVRKKRKHS